MFPSMKDAFFGFTDMVQFAKVSKAVVDYEVVETKADVEWFSGILEPINAQRLERKPEGQRNWKHWDLWTTEKLVNDDVIQDSCHKQYRVSSVQDWRKARYYFYELVEQVL